MTNSDLNLLSFRYTPEDFLAIYNTMPYFPCPDAPPDAVVVSEADCRDPAKAVTFRDPFNVTVQFPATKGYFFTGPCSEEEGSIPFQVNSDLCIRYHTS